jgi:hypothetical protein
MITGETANSTMPGCCLMTARALFARTRSISFAMPLRMPAVGLMRIEPLAAIEFRSVDDDEARDACSRSVGLGGSIPALDFGHMTIDSDRAIRHITPGKRIVGGFWEAHG